MWARRDRGVVFILAVFAVALLSVLAVAITAAVRVELRAARTSLERVQALFLAQAGLAQARAVLLYDDRTLDTLYDDWGPLAADPLEAPHRLGDGFWRVRVQDACGRININTADPETLLALTGDPEVAGAILEWRDAGSVAGQEYYESLPYPYLPRRGPFQTPGELLLVRGVTPDLYFGRDGWPGLAHLVTVEGLSPNVDAEGRLRVGLNEFRNWGEEAFRKSVLARLENALSEYEAGLIFNGLIQLSTPGEGYTSLAQLATVAGLSYDAIGRIADLMTVEPGIAVSGRVNVNTAPAEVIAALPGGSVELGMAFVERRQVQPFATLGEVMQFLLEQPNGPELFARMIDRVDAKSSSYIIEAMGYTEEGRTFRTLWALVRRSAHGVEVVQQTEVDWPLPPWSRADRRTVASLAEQGRQSPTGWPEVRRSRVARAQRAGQH